MVIKLIIPIIIMETLLNELIIECVISYLNSDPKKDSKFGPYWKEFSFANGTKDYDDIKSSFNNKPISMFTYGMVDDVSTDKNAYRYNPYWNFSS